MRANRFVVVGLLCLAVLAGLAGVAAGLSRSAAAGLSDPLPGEGADQVGVGQTTIAGIEVFNRSGATVRFENVRLIPMPGFRTPRLVGLRRAHYAGGFYEASHPASGLAAGLRTLRRIRLRSGKNTVAGINLEFVAPTSGDYGFSAVQFTVLKSGKRVRFATRGGAVAMCVGKHPSVRLCPGYHTLMGLFGSYRGWLGDKHNISGNGVSQRVHRAFPLLDRTPTVTTPHRRARSFDTVPIGSTMLAANTPLATSPENYLNDDYSPNTIVTVLHHSRGLQIYAEDYYGVLSVFSVGKRAGSISYGTSLYGIDTTSAYLHGPQYLSTLVPRWVHHVQVRLQDRKRLRLRVKADAVTYFSRQAFAIVYPIGHGKVLFLMAGNYTRQPPGNAVFAPAARRASPSLAQQSRAIRSSERVGNPLRVR